MILVGGLLARTLNNFVIEMTKISGSSLYNLSEDNGSNGYRMFFCYLTCQTSLTVGLAGLVERNSVI